MSTDFVLKERTEDGFGHGISRDFQFTSRLFDHASVIIGLIRGCARETKLLRNTQQDSDFRSVNPLISGKTALRKRYELESLVGTTSVDAQNMKERRREIQLLDVTLPSRFGNAGHYSVKRRYTITQRYTVTSPRTSNILLTEKKTARQSRESKRHSVR